MTLRAQFPKREKPSRKQDMVLSTEPFHPERLRVVGVVRFHILSRFTDSTWLRRHLSTSDVGIQIRAAIHASSRFAFEAMSLSPLPHVGGVTRLAKLLRWSGWGAASAICHVPFYRQKDQL